MTSAFADSRAALEELGLTDVELDGLVWPTPPYACYRPLEESGDALACEVMGNNGQPRACNLVRLDGVERIAHIQVPPSRATMPLRFSMFQRITLKHPLEVSPGAPSAPGSQPSGGVDLFSDLLTYRPRVPYRLVLIDGTEVSGETVGHQMATFGLYLFLPLNDDGTVQRVFYPKEGFRHFQLGDAIGQVLVTQHAVTLDQVERAAREQETIRNRKLGDYLVIKEIVSADQLLQALEQQSRMPMVRIGEALTALGLISPEQLDDALEKQKQERTVPLGELLVRSGQLARHDLQVALARKMGFPVVDVKHFAVDAEALRRVPYAMARRLKTLPLLWRDGLMVVATEDPTRRAVVDELEFTIQGKVVAALASAAVLPGAIREAYAKVGLDGGAKLDLVRDDEGEAEGAEPSSSMDELLEHLEAGLDGQPEEDEKPIEQSDNSLVRLINTMISDAQRQGASDIHIETYATKRKVRIRFRKDGALSPYMELPHTYRAALVARIKIMCDLDISERRKPQDGKIDFSRFSRQHRLELRVATIPTQNGAEDVVMRLLASAKPVPMEKLGLLPSNLERLGEVVERPYGMVLVVGPTGSGKTTTLHSVLAHINKPDTKIWTAEDPIEITNPDLRQVQVNPKIDWTFAKALRAFLRADPDVIMVGEIRDKETAQMAIEASLTGHLVLSTLHTNSAPETVTRLLDMGMDPFNFADSLLAVLAQRLVRRLCNECKQAEPADDVYVNELMDDYLRGIPEADRPKTAALRKSWEQTYGRSGKLQRYRPVGCKVCDNSGLKGRVGVHELMISNPAIRRLIQTGGRTEEIQLTAMQGGHFYTLRQDGILKTLQGDTTIDEVRATTNV